MANGALGGGRQGSRRGVCACVPHSEEQDRADQWWPLPSPRKGQPWIRGRVRGVLWDLCAPGLTACSPSASYHAAPSTPYPLSPCPSSRPPACPDPLAFQLPLVQS